MMEIISAVLNILPEAIGIAISPVPIVGLILILLSKKAKTNSLCYGAGWFFGNMLVFVIALLFLGGISAGSDDPSLIVRIIKIILGLLLLLVGVKAFSGRPKEGEKPKTPAWFDKISEIKPGKALAFGAFLADLNPKNLLLSISAGVAVGTLNLNTAQNISATLIFTVIASVTILIPIIAFFILGNKSGPLLEKVKTFLIKYNSLIMAILMFTLGIKTIITAL